MCMITNSKLECVTNKRKHLDLYQHLPRGRTRIAVWQLLPTAFHRRDLWETQC
jgi:hypothetical protein